MIMLSILTRAKLAIAVLMVAAAPAGTAFAGEGNGPSYPGSDIPNVTVSKLGKLLGPTHSGNVLIGGTLPSSSNGQGEPQPINSLPPGFENGTLAMQHRQALHHYWAEQAHQARHYAATSQQPNG
jgi:hypothetical protein